MRILVAYDSRHGSTREIALAIADELASHEHHTVVHNVDEVVSIEQYDAVVLGSAIYIGQWQKGAMRLIDENAPLLRTKPVWLFSSGPIGADPFPTEEPPATAELIEKTGAREHRSFPGMLDRSTLGFGERLIMSVMRAPEGDFRDWGAIRSWGASIATELAEIEAMVTSMHE